MTLWFGLALMTAAAIMAVLWPLARRASPSRSGSDVAIYRDPLDEIERDLPAGLIENNEAVSAQVEVSRRLIAAADAQPAPPSDVSSASWRRRAVAIVALLLLPLGATGLYLALGSPLLPDQPLAPRLAAARGDQSVDTLIAQVEAHLARNPEDGRGWEVLAPVYLRLGRYDDAVKARRNSLRLNEKTAEREAALGEALVFAASGLVTTDARAAFERATALDSANVQARYFLGLAAEQDGDRKRAEGIWGALLADAGDAPWGEFVRAALRRVAEPAAAGPSQEQIAAAAQMTEEQRSATIRSMVDR